MNTKKGMTIVELLVSVVLISLVLMFIMQICLRARNAYLNNNFNAKYELSKSIIIDAVMDDYINKDINTIDNTSNSITFNYKDGTIKELSVKETQDDYIIEYSGGTDPIVAREYKKNDITYNGIIKTNMQYVNNKLTEYKIQLIGKDGYNYTINIYCAEYN